jgi:hypothetical protein
MFEDRMGHMLLSRNAVVFYYEFCLSALRAILLNDKITIWKIQISRANS